MNRSASLSPISPPCNCSPKRCQVLGRLIVDFSLPRPRDLGRRYGCPQHIYLGLEAPSYLWRLISCRIMFYLGIITLLHFCFSIMVPKLMILLISVCGCKLVCRFVYILVWIFLICQFVCFVLFWFICFVICLFSKERKMVCTWNDGAEGRIWKEIKEGKSQLEHIV